MPSRRGLLAAFLKVRALVQLPDNNFDWSSWENAEAALSEIDAIVKYIRRGKIPSAAEILFLPTGPLQETSLSSGWGSEFVEIANQFDAALAAEPDCSCFLDPGSLVPTAGLGVDKRYAEVSLLHCPSCGQQWVRYFYEMEAFPKSGRWFLGAVDGDVSAETAQAALEYALEYWQGGSYFDGTKTLSHGPIGSL